LASASAERSFALELPHVATVGDVVATLQERLGEEFAASVTDETGAKRRSCRIFVDGAPVENLRTALWPAQEPTQIEFILLVAPEGG
jgi:hypothetical protein